MSPEVCGLFPAQGTITETVKEREGRPFIKQSNARAEMLKA